MAVRPSTRENECECVHKLIGQLNEWWWNETEFLLVLVKEDGLGLNICICENPGTVVSRSRTRAAVTLWPTDWPGPCVGKARLGDFPQSGWKTTIALRKVWKRIYTKHGCQHSPVKSRFIAPYHNQPLIITLLVITVTVSDHTVPSLCHSQSINTVSPLSKHDYVGKPNTLPPLFSAHRYVCVRPRVILALPGTYATARQSPNNGTALDALLNWSSPLNTREKR